MINDSFYSCITWKFVVLSTDLTGCCRLCLDTLTALLFSFMYVDIIRSVWCPHSRTMSRCVNLYNLTCSVSLVSHVHNKPKVLVSCLAEHIHAAPTLTRTDCYCVSPGACGARINTTPDWWKNSNTVANNMYKQRNTESNANSFEEPLVQKRRGRVWHLFASKMTRFSRTSQWARQKIPTGPAVPRADSI